MLGTTDIDLFISLKQTTPGTLQQLYESLYDRAQTEGWVPRRQNVSIGITYGGAKVDLVPGRLQPGSSAYHSLWRRKARSWTQTNVGLHVSTVRNSNRVNEIRLLKIWRKCHGLDFPSFYLELTVIAALAGCRDNLESNVQRALKYINEHLENRVCDRPVEHEQHHLGRPHPGGEEGDRGPGRQVVRRSVLEGHALVGPWRRTGSRSSTRACRGSSRRISTRRGTRTRTRTRVEAAVRRCVHRCGFRTQRTAADRFRNRRGTRVLRGEPREKRDQNVSPGSRALRVPDPASGAPPGARDGTVKLAFVERAGTRDRDLSSRQAAIVTASQMRKERPRSSR